MVATVEARVLHGVTPALGVDVTGTTLRFKQADNDVADASNPVPIPAAGFNYSWRKSFLLVVVTAPDNQISNLRFFADPGSLGTGRRSLFASAASYTQASAADASTPISAVDVTTKTAASPEVLQAGELVNDTDTFPTSAGTSGSQNVVELQLEVGPTATAGNGPGALTLRYRYDES